MARAPRRRVTTTSAGPGAATDEAPRRVRENLPRPAAAPSPAAGGARPAPHPRKRRSPLAFLGRLEPRWVADIVGELRKVTWPTFAETRYLTIVVAIVSVVVGTFLGLIDLAFGKIIETLFF